MCFDLRKTFSVKNSKNSFFKLFKLIRAHGKGVRQINIKTGETIKEFRTASEACVKLNKKNNGRIGMVCNRTKELAFGYDWEWV